MSPFSLLIEALRSRTWPGRRLSEHSEQNRGLFGRSPFPNVETTYEPVVRKGHAIFRGKRKAFIIVNPTMKLHFATAVFDPVFTRMKLFVERKSLETRSNV